MFPIFIRVPILHVTAITFWLVVFYKGEINEKTRQHETIHYLQYCELLVLGFWVVYLWDFLKAYYVIREFWPAYERIRFEQEAYEHDDNEFYALERQPFAWKEYTV